MDEYKDSPLWKKAYEVGRAVDILTQDFPQHNTLIRFLREKTAALPMVLSSHADALVDAPTLKSAYELAHDAEYVLFFSLLFRYVPYTDASGLFLLLHEIKRLIVAEMKAS